MPAPTESIAQPAASPRSFGNRPADAAPMEVYFSDHFRVRPSDLARYGAFNISLIADMPLFIDPFLLFNSRKPAYQKLHAEMIRYLSFLREKAAAGVPDAGSLRHWYSFKEVPQNWLGFSRMGNRGHALGRGFAIALHDGLSSIFQDFGAEKITKGHHLEKLCLVRDGVGRDCISDFTTNLILDFLCKYTQAFARKKISPIFRRRVRVPRAKFNYGTCTWEEASYDLPRYRGTFVLLTPKDILTRSETWINRNDLLSEFGDVPEAIPNEELRAKCACRSI